MDCEGSSTVWHPGRTCVDLGYVFEVKESEEWGDSTFYADEGDHSTPGANGAFADGHGGNGGFDGGGGGGGGGGGDAGTTRPKVGAFELLIYPPAGDCAAPDGVAGTFTIYTYCTSNNGPSQFTRRFEDYAIFSNWSSNGYWYLRFGSEADNPGMIPCENGVPYFDTRIEYQAHPEKSSWPNHCNVSGAADIEFDGQHKQVRLYAP